MPTIDPTATGQRGLAALRHELSNSTAAIDSCALTIAEQTTDSVQRLARMIHRQAERLEWLLDSLMDDHLPGAAQEVEVQTLGRQAATFAGACFAGEGEERLVTDGAVLLRALQLLALVAATGGSSRVRHRRGGVFTISGRIRDVAYPPSAWKVERAAELLSTIGFSVEQHTSERGTAWTVSR